MRIILPIRTHSEMNLREHWAVKARRAKQQRQLVRLCLGREVRPIMENLPVIVTMTRIAPRMLDVGDNLECSFKHIRDEIAAIFKVNDRDPRITWRVDQRRGLPKQYEVEIEIERIVAKGPS